METYRPFGQSFGPVEFVLWGESVEVVNFLETQPEDALLDPFAAELVKELQNTIRLIVQNAMRKIAHLKNDDVRCSKVLTEIS